MKSDSKIKKVPTPVVGGNGVPQKVTVGNLDTDKYPPPKTSGIRVRGGKAQTKGFMARGPMA
jgi:hypothetical protein